MNIENLMNIEIKEITNRRLLKKSIIFANNLYKGNKYSCPILVADEMAFFNKNINPVYDFSESVHYIAYKDGNIVGRITGIINTLANEKWNVRNVRFGYFDFIEDYNVFKGLLDAVVAWGKTKGMTKLNGPVGFTDLDKEGLLIEGFEEQTPMPMIYNYPYYEAFYNRYGLRKEADWVELFINVPKELPEKLVRVGEYIMERRKLKAVKCKNTKEFKDKYSIPFSNLFEICYEQLYNVSPMTDRLKQYYLNQFLPILNFEVSKSKPIS